MKQLLAFITLITITPLYSAIGCRDTSNHTNIWSDHKTLHLVQCNCPCGSDDFHAVIAQKKNMCLQCRHYRFAQDCNPINPPQANIQKSIITSKVAHMKMTPWIRLNKTIHPQGKKLYRIFKNSFINY